MHHRCNNNEASAHAPRMRRQMICGVEWVYLESDAVSLAIVPEFGAKIVSLCNRRTGREWLWRAPDAQLRHVRADTPFPEAPLIGADECIPTIAPCRWRDRNLPDHGEAWSRPWELDVQSGNQARVVTRIDLTCYPLTLTRAVTLHGRTVTLNYELISHATTMLEYLWAFHPFLQLKTGDRIVLPSNIECNIEFAVGGGFVAPRGTRWRWPIPCPGVDLARCELADEGRAVKLYTDPGATGQAALTNDASGDSLTFDFDVQQIDTVGIWINRGGWNGFHHVAIEPCCGAPDALDQAVRGWRRYEQIERGEIRQWSFTMTLTP